MVFLCGLRVGWVTNRSPLEHSPDSRHSGEVSHYRRAFARRGPRSSLSYQYVPHPWSILEGVAKLPPGHWLSWREGRLQVERYWTLRYTPKRILSEQAAAEETLALLEEAVRLRLMSEVPLGCFLSGGVDSWAVVAMMRRHVTGELRTFSIGFREDEFNELPYAPLIAARFETRHEEFFVEPSALECLGRLAWHLDEPMARARSRPTTSRN